MSELGWRFLTRAQKRAILRGIEEGTVHGGPYHLEVHPTDRCNLGCFFCSTRGLRTGHELDFATIRRLVAEMRDVGTHSVCLSGGGEPLVHPRILEIVELLARSQIHVGTLTTNGIGLHREITEHLLDVGCNQLRVSLNCSNEADYARMMHTAPATFHRVVDNVQRLLADRARRGVTRPDVIVQFLPYKANFRSIPEMYELALGIGVDGIVFNGLAYMGEDSMMTAAETNEMLMLFEQVLRIDEYRRIRGIYSLEQDISQALVEIERRIAGRRAQRPAWKRFVDLARRSDFSIGEKWRHHWRMHRRRRIQTMLRTGDDPCIMPWYTMTVRADGRVPICCVLQGSGAESVQDRSLTEIWKGPRMNRMRVEMRRVIAQGPAWRFDPRRDTEVRPMCSCTHPGADRCHIRSFYYCWDLRFFHALRRTAATL
ncbi:MAG: radical SAM protein [bacterium]|nr:radical SAM protein [bacterium]